MENIFEGKVCIVTGGASGIGYGLSEELLKRGAIVYVLDVREESVKDAQERLKECKNARFATADVTIEEQVRTVIEDAAKENGHLDYLFNNAGIGATLPFEEVPLEFWKKVIDINLWGVIYGINAAFPIMNKQGFGHIVNTSSIAGILPTPYQTLYCTTKFGVLGLGVSLSYELEAKGIFVSTICPSNVATPIFGDYAPPKDAISVEEAVQIILNGVVNKEKIIILPEKAKEMVLEFINDLDKFDAFLKNMADERRQAYETGGNYY